MTDRALLIAYLTPLTTGYPPWLTKAIELYDTFVAHDLADDGFVEKITQSMDFLLQGVWEMRLAASLIDAGYLPTKLRHGPDFRVEVDGRPVWIEAIAPTKGVGPDAVPEQAANGVTQWPERQILLRYTSAIRAKMEKQRAYLREGIIAENEPYVIAVSSIALSWMGAFRGVNQLPYVLTALFGIGPMQLYIDRQTGRTTGQDYAHQPILVNRNDAPIAADQFLNPAYRNVSAVLSVNGAIIHTGAPSQGYESVVVHNPLAVAPLPLNALGARLDYHVPDSNDQWADWQIHTHENIVSGGDTAIEE